MEAAPVTGRRGACGRRRRSGAAGDRQALGRPSGGGAPQRLRGHPWWPRKWWTSRYGVERNGEAEDRAPHHEEGGRRRRRRGSPAVGNTKSPRRTTSATSPARSALAGGEACQRRRPPRIFSTRERSGLVRSRAAGRRAGGLGERGGKASLCGHGLAQPVSKRVSPSRVVARGRACARSARRRSSARGGRRSRCADRCVRSGRDG